LYKRGFRQPQLLGVKPLSEVVDGFVGEAFTMRFIPMREDVDGLDPYRSGNTLQWEAFEALQPGQVLVVDSYRTATAASGGDMLMTRAWKRGAAAVVTDGSTTSPTSTCRSGAPVSRSTPATCWSGTATACW
jgi:regulator of RNase E activity RraA